MIGRVADDRIGYFTVSYNNIGYYPSTGNVHSKISSRIDPRVHLVSKWRIEVDPTTCTVKKGVTYFIDPSVPERWWSFVTAGVLEWNQAFTPAVLKCDSGTSVVGNVISASTPTDSDFPSDYSAADARYNSISWAFSKGYTFALGPSHVDPRSGEILNADIVFTHSWFKSYATTFDLYGLKHSHQEKNLFSGLRGPECRVFENEDEAVLLSLMFGGSYDGLISDSDMISVVGSAIKEVTMHEVGHTLGLRHNFKASSSFKWEDLQNSSFVEANGLSASVMDYLAINIQRNPANQTSFFSPTIGAYDKWAIRYGYSVIDGEVTGQLHQTLKQIASEVETNSWLRFGTDEDDSSPSGMDPLSNVFDLSSNPLEFYMDRVLLVNEVRETIMNRTTAAGDNFDDLYSAEISLLRQISSAGQYAAKYIGGFEFSKSHRTSGSSNPSPIELPCPHQQRKALNFTCQLLQNDSIVFPPPALFEFLVERQGDCEGLHDYCFGTGSIDVVGIVTRLRMGIINVLTDYSRLQRMQNNIWAQQNSSSVVTVQELFSTISNAIVMPSFDLTTGEVVPWRLTLVHQWIQKLKNTVVSLSVGQDIIVVALGELLRLQDFFESLQSSNPKNYLLKSLSQLTQASKD
eukprot:TRINITY_DN8986_c0_g1_i1.p1 TRINITY_DN8986_c0_g1~~TRINITY_DN8986_c0_g1_i1.p1  ORF type:complete len:631 (+),score=159.01 TRINITY_DN8986_c0_g1_i1:832-2724(+)